MRRSGRNVRESFWSSAPSQASEDPIGYIASVIVKDYDPDELFGNKGFKAAAKAIKKQGYAPLEVEEELSAEGVDDDIASEITAEIFDEGGPNPIDFKFESRKREVTVRLTTEQLRRIIREEAGTEVAWAAHRLLPSLPIMPTLYVLEFVNNDGVIIDEGGKVLARLGRGEAAYPMPLVGNLEGSGLYEAQMIDDASEIPGWKGRLLSDEERIRS